MVLFRNHLTHDSELNEKASDGLSADLALISPRVSLLDVFDLQNPLIVLWIVNGLIAKVSGVSVTTYGEDMEVLMTDPRDLKRTKVMF